VLFCEGAVRKFKIQPNPPIPGLKYVIAVVENIKKVCAFFFVMNRDIDGFLKVKRSL
jgi:hypothetical protein